VMGDELNEKTDHSYHKYQPSPSQLDESSFSSKPFALPRPSLVRLTTINIALACLFSLSKAKTNLNAMAVLCWGQGAQAPQILPRSPKFLIGSIVISLAVVASQMMRGQPPKYFS